MFRKIAKITAVLTFLAAILAACTSGSGNAPLPNAPLVKADQQRLTLQIAYSNPNLDASAGSPVYAISQAVGRALPDWRPGQVFQPIVIQPTILAPISQEPGHYSYPDGSIFVDPDPSEPTDDAAAPLDVGSETATSPPTCKNTGFQGSTPPNCSYTGPFRRVYSAPNTAGIAFAGVFPADDKSMPPSPSPYGAQGYIYGETWSQPYGSNSEGGFINSPTTKSYALYEKVYSGQVAGKAVYTTGVFDGIPRIPEGDSYSLSIIAYPLGSPTFPKNSSVQCSMAGCLMITYASSYSQNCKSGYAVIQSPNYTGNVVIGATMTSIAETHFTVIPGYVFGPNIMSTIQSYLIVNGYPSYQPELIYGGVQNWPNDSSRIIVKDATHSMTSPARETDEINLHR